MRKQFTKLIISQKNKATIASTFDELLTDTEKIMLYKRIALILMLRNGASQNEVHTTLSASWESIARWNTALQNGELESITGKMIVRKGNEEGFLEIVESILTLGKHLPAYGTSPATYIRQQYKDKNGSYSPK